MPFNLLLLPLVGGYLFLYFFDLTDYLVKRLQGYQIIIFSAVPAIISLSISICITHFGSKFLFNVSWYWKKIIPFEYSGTAFIGLMLCISTPFLLNRVISEDFKHKSLRWFIFKDGNALEMLLNKAINEQQDVAITLLNHKVYIGIVGKFYNVVSDQENFIEIIPFISGYRDPLNKKLNLTTSYLDTLVNSDLEIEDFAIVIPTKQILSANIFDIEVFDKHFRQTEKESSKA